MAVLNEITLILKCVKQTALWLFRKAYIGYTYAFFSFKYLNFQYEPD